MTKSELTVYIVDDDEGVLKGLTRLLQAEGRKTRTFNSPKTFLERVTPDLTGCLILDVAMPGMDGLEIQEALNEASCMLPIIFLTGHGDVPMSVRAMKAGACDFLTKPVNAEDLLAAVDHALDLTREKMADRSRSDCVTRLLDTLTPREHEVMMGVVQGKLNKQVADDLGIAVKTVKVHRGRVMKKMGVQSLAELVQIAVRLEIIPQDSGLSSS